MATEPPEPSEALGPPERRPTPGTGIPSLEISPHITQLLFELNGTVGEIKNAVQTLTKTVGDHGGKIDALTKKIWIAVGALGVILPAGAFIIGKTWDKIFVVLPSVPTP